MGAAEHTTLITPQSFLSLRLEKVFNDCFALSHNTRLSGGADEPFYLPGTAPGVPHSLNYRADYFASALHEVAHWCIAGSQRRQQLDFGYWYTPATRSADQQRAFEMVECKPQALEWFFSRACSYRFQVSADNPDLANAGMLDTAAFKSTVLEQALAWQKSGLPARAEAFYAALCLEFGTTVASTELDFTLAMLAC
jgi:elongation factor P hydroxylase